MFPLTILLDEIPVNKRLISQTFTLKSFSRPYQAILWSLIAKISFKSHLGVRKNTLEKDRVIKNVYTFMLRQFVKI